MLYAFATGIWQRSLHTHLVIEIEVVSVFTMSCHVQPLIEILSQKPEHCRFQVLRETLRHLNLKSVPEVIPQWSLSPLLQYLIDAPTSRYQQPQNPFSHLQASVVLGEHEDVEFQQLPLVTAPDWAGGQLLTARQPPGSVAFG